MIILETPDCEPGQQSALAMKCEPLDVVRVAFVGVGGRGSAAVYRWTKLEDVDIVALCDLEQNKIDNVNKMLEENG